MYTYPNKTIEQLQQEHKEERFQAWNWDRIAREQEGAESRYSLHCSAVHAHIADKLHAALIARTRRG